MAREFLRGVVASNRLYIRMAKAKGRPLPRVYESDVEWRREPWAGKFEEFEDCLTALRRGWADCDGLAAWRVAELLEDGDNAQLKIKWKVHPKTGEVRLFHALVRRNPRWDPVRKRFTGPTEDPSRRLGMGRQRRRAA